ncbi:MAG: beta-lactamase family protein [Burkholderiales bacterium]|nr:beta-lactamase family protein [Burkholderiales bacterium]
MEEIQATAAHEGRRYAVAGRIEPRFAAVRDIFTDNFARGLELGACVAVTVDGKPVVDLWGGYADPGFERPWQENSIVCMMSVSKAVSALCVWMLADRGRIDIDAPVARYWPEFAQSGKEDLKIRHVMDHRAGMAVITEPVPRGSVYDAALITAALARQPCAWKPGEDAGYHVLTQGFLLAELVRRVSGATLGEFFRREFGAPLGLDYHIGLKPEEIARCAEFHMPPSCHLRSVIREAKGKDGVFWQPLSPDEDFNSPRWRAAEIPSANGHGNARAVARLYGAIARGGTLEGVKLMSPEVIARMSAEQHNLKERYLGRHYHQALGVVLNTKPNAWMGPNPRAFGHQGAGGAIGFADPDARVGFAYAMNRFHEDVTVPTRAAMIEAVYEALGGR